MSNVIATREETPVKVGSAAMEKVLVTGNLSALTPAERLNYVGAVCQSLGLNPLTRPFEYITLNGKLTLYARKDATDQLRSIHNVSVYKLESNLVEDVYTVTAYGRDKSGREDCSTGAVSMAGLKGEARANGLMKAETKAKRRLTLSLCGLGMLDETELETIQGTPNHLEAKKLQLAAMMEHPAHSMEERERFVNWIEGDRTETELDQAIGKVGRKCDAWDKENPRLPEAPAVEVQQPLPEPKTRKTAKPVEGFKTPAQIKPEITDSDLPNFDANINASDIPF